jgi:hypothetical protein
VNTKAELLRKLDETRKSLWRELASISDTTQITPGITKREVYAHNAGWEALVFEALRAYIYGIPAHEFS